MSGAGAGFWPWGGAKWWLLGEQCGIANWMNMDTGEMHDVKIGPLMERGHRWDTSPDEVPAELRELCIRQA